MPSHIASGESFSQRLSGGTRKDMVRSDRRRFDGHSGDTQQDRAAGPSAVPGGLWQPRQLLPIAGRQLVETASGMLDASEQRSGHGRPLLRRQRYLREVSDAAGQGSIAATRTPGSRGRVGSMLSWL